jgi:hypothetical protein
MTLFHVSGWESLPEVKVGESFVLVPGTQCAEGRGVYFSEEAPRLTAAEGAHMRPSAVVVITTTNNEGWWQSKRAKARKFKKPRTWHTDGKKIQCCLDHQEEMTLECGMVVCALYCSWAWI